MQSFTQLYMHATTIIARLTASLLHITFLHLVLCEAPCTVRNRGFGYRLHLTETCDEETPDLITQNERRPHQSLGHWTHLRIARK